MNYRKIANGLIIRLIIFLLIVNEKMILEKRGF